MKSLFRFLHIINLMFVAFILVVHAATWGEELKGVGFQFWLGFYQLSLGIIQLLSVRFFSDKTKKALTLYWGFVGVWLIIMWLFLPYENSHVYIVPLIVLPMLIACYSVYVSWHALKDISNYKPKP